MLPEEIPTPTTSSMAIDPEKKHCPITSARSVLALRVLEPSMIFLSNYNVFQNRMALL
jgi:hypothetical protein